MRSRPALRLPVFLLLTAVMSQLVDARSRALRGYVAEEKGARQGNARDLR